MSQHRSENLRNLSILSKKYSEVHHYRRSPSPHPFTKVCLVASQSSKQPEALDPMLAEGWLDALVGDGLVFTADKVNQIQFVQ